MSTAKKNRIRNEIVTVPRKTKVLKCLSCGDELRRPRRRYCSDECRHKINWVLSLSKGLLRAFSTRYAAFSFTQAHVILDVLPTWSDVISRFIWERKAGNKPAEDLKRLVLQSGREWYEIIENKKSRSYASLMMLDRQHNKNIDPRSIKPDRKIAPKLTAKETNCLKILQLKKDVLCEECQSGEITSAYRKMAKVHHPDMGGDAEKFKELNEAHKQMLLWAENPSYRNTQTALQDCWSYDAFSNRWKPPL